MLWKWLFREEFCIFTYSKKRSTIFFCFSFWLLWHGCLLVFPVHICMYLCSETLQGYSDSISGRTPPSCGRSSEPRRAAWSSTGTAWEPEPGSSLWTRVTPGRRAEQQYWIHLCTTHESPHKHAHTHTGRSKQNKNRIKKWMQLCLARSAGS